MTISSSSTLAERSGQRAVTTVLSLGESRLSPVSRSLALPPHHPGRTRDEESSYPYRRWSPGFPAPAPTKAPGLVRIRGRHLEAAVDLTRGGRVTELHRVGGGGYEACPELVVNGEDARGAGLRGGVEINASVWKRSPWALQPVHAAVGLPTRLGGERLRWWETERASGYLFQADLHLPDDLPVLLVVMRQVPIPGQSAPQAPLVSALLDDAPGVAHANVERGMRIIASGEFMKQSRTVEARLAPIIGGESAISWFALGFQDLDGSALQAALALDLARAFEALNDPVDQVCGRLLRSHDQTAVGVSNCDRSVERGPLQAATPLPPARELSSDEGPGDWQRQLALGERALVDGDLATANDSWTLAHDQHPCAASSRNLALLDLRRGSLDLAAARYLRAQREEPGDVELAIEVLGCLLRAGRLEDCRIVLQRLRAAGCERTARYWLLVGEVAAASTDDNLLALSLAAAGLCADATAHACWAADLATSARRMTGPEDVA
jgi:hypothetical protein